MLKNVLRIVDFLINHPTSFVNVNLWARTELRNNQLTAMADATGSDKGSKKHMFTRIYDALFADKRKDVANLLEIGLLCHKDQNLIGGKSFSSVPSLEMWAKYFPLARIYGFDDKDFTSARGTWTQIFRGDQCKREDLAQISKVQEPFDVIIDDALHASYHQQITFSYLFGLVKPGGYFIIEDLHYQPCWAEEQYPVGKTFDYLRKLNEEGVWTSPVATSEERLEIESNVESVDFFDSMSQGVSGANALAVIKKKS
ncbi:hypothetical protein [Desulfoluna butyratoxydans]|uniref:S-adenosyl-l-methionine-dependent methyltransferase n=1 Tax=Desulfoluna butyratoxydans TaxID=231438 RepID=A0A4V6IM30_9BACT|nr:hypothetical protein [Desulfoluna butyratoxydans]VFQ47458.1 s-adenosyl-l-methionine-dependent methyltransferase [Desulfoluna butyratoxydans]